MSVVIVTWRRPDWVRRCLGSLDQMSSLPDEVVVVDASEDSRTADVVADFPWCTYLRFPGGAGHMTTARNAGLWEMTGDVIAFLDDDVEVWPRWLTELREVYSDRTVDAVAGRTCNGQAGEDRAGADQIGVLLPDGTLTGNFAAAPGGLTDIDHGIGANMSFRADVVKRLGGFRDDFPGSALREDADMFLRITRFGGRAVFAPEAGVDHRGAPHVRGRRFDSRYRFWGIHNHALLLARNFGLASAVMWRWQASVLRETLVHRTSPIRWAGRLTVTTAGLLAGMVTAVRVASWRPLAPTRFARRAVPFKRFSTAVRRTEPSG